MTDMRLDVRLTHPVERVWAALTESRHLSKWLRPCDGDITRGNRFEITGGGELGLPDPVAVEVEAAVVGQRIRMKWRAARQVARVSWRLVPVDDGCRLLVEQGTIGEPDEAAIRWCFEAALPRLLAGLRDGAGTVPPAAMPSGPAGPPRRRRVLTAAAAALVLGVVAALLLALPGPAPQAAGHPGGEASVAGSGGTPGAGRPGSAGRSGGGTAPAKPAPGGAPAGATTGPGGPAGTTPAPSGGGPTRTATPTRSPSKPPALVLAAYLTTSSSSLGYHGQLTLTAVAGPQRDWWVAVDLAPGARVTRSDALYEQQGTTVTFRPSPLQLPVTLATPLIFGFDVARTAGPNHPLGCRVNGTACTGL